MESDAISPKTAKNLSRRQPARAVRSKLSALCLQLGSSRSQLQAEHTLEVLAIEGQQFRCSGAHGTVKRRAIGSPLASRQMLPCSGQPLREVRVAGPQAPATVKVKSRRRPLAFQLTFRCLELVPGGNFGGGG